MISFYIIFIVYNLNSQDNYKILAEKAFERSNVFYRNNNLDSALEEMKNAQELYSKAGDYENSVFCQTSVSTTYYLLGEFELCQFALDKAIVLAENYKLTSSKVYAGVLNNYAIIHRIKGDFSKAIKLLYQVIELSKKNNEFYLSQYYESLATTYELSGDYIKAINYLQLAISKSSKDEVESIRMANIFSLLGELNGYLDNNNLMNKYFSKAEVLYDEIGNEQAERYKYKWKVKLLSHKLDKNEIHNINTLVDDILENVNLFNSIDKGIFLFSFS